MATPNRRSRRFAGVWPKTGVAVVTVVAGVMAGVATAGLLGQRSDSVAEVDSSEGAARCVSEMDPIDVVADDTVVPIVQELADMYAADLLEDGRDCVHIDVRTAASSAVVGRLINGWRTQTHGPQPEVWIPRSTLWVEVLREDLQDPRMVPDEPTVLARSPTVIAMPRPMAEALGWPNQELSWQDFLQFADSDAGWADHGHPEWGPFRLRLTDPRYTTTGLQALLALDAAQSDEDAQDSGTSLSLFRVQRVLAGIDASSTEELRGFAEADEPVQYLSAFPLEERELWQFNERRGPFADAGEGSESESGNSPPLAAVYPTGNSQIAMESDYPYVLLNADWVEEEVLQYADEFGDYLLSDQAADLFADAGFRTPDNKPSPVLRADDNVRPADVVSGPSPGELPDVNAVRRLRTSWVTVPRLSSTLFAVDVSGSMVESVPGTDRTRLEATVEAAKQSIDILPSGSDVGLWEFSTDLPGGRNDGDYRELVTLGPLNEVVYGSTRKASLKKALDGLEPENDTALNETVLAAYRTLRASYIPGQRHTIVLLSDGRNDDEGSISHERLLDELQALRNPNQPIQIVSIAYGETDVDELSQISEMVGGRVLESPNLSDLDRLLVEALSR